MAHHHDHGSHGRAAKKALTVALVATGGFATIELIAGLVFHSLALTADAVHMFSDAAALAAALIAQHIAGRPASKTHSFGWRRAEVLAAFGNALVLVIVCAWIVWEAIGRLGDAGDQVDINAPGLVAVALLGLAINLYCTRLLRRSDEHNVNVRAAALHTMSDAAGSMGAILAGVVIVAGGPDWVDPVVSIFISALVLHVASGLLRETSRVLLEASPSDLDPSAIEAALADEASVMRVHHLHIWSLAPGSPALSAHVELRDIETLHEAQSEGVRLKQMLSERFALDHATLELECHPCAPGESTH